MPRKVEIEYNPYNPQLKVVIDGVQIPTFSRLVQYSDEYIWQWAPEIIDALYAEVHDDFILSFIGTDQDAEIVRFISNNHDKCVGFRNTQFPIVDSLPKRMGKLNQLIKKAGITSYHRMVVDATFLVSPIHQDLLDDILKIDINNLFCAVRVSTIGEKCEYEETENSVLFILVDSVEQGARYLKRISVHKPAFVLVIGNENRILSIANNNWCFEVTKDKVFDMIFQCFIQMPLTVAFRKCLESIKGGNKLTKELKVISAIEPIINIKTEKSVEPGKSIRIEITQTPNVGSAPKLIFKIRNEKIASCDGLSVYGLSEGDCVLEVYKLGAKQPFFTKNIHVYKRNRITSLVLSDDTLLMGVSDTENLILDYYPVDADNVDEILWKSTDEKVLKVDNEGNVEAVGPGSCRIICTAENVSAQCMCTVKYHLEDLEFDAPVDENGNIKIEALQEVELTYKCVPDDCMDGDITIKSNNPDIVNVVRNVLYAKKCGETTIVITNSTNRISRVFNVVVSKAKRKKNKNGFFNKLFK